MGLLSKEKKEKVRELYQNFRKDYTQEKRQNLEIFTKWAFDVITETLKNPLKNEYLQGLIHILKFNATNNTVDSYLKKIIKEKNIQKQLFKRFENLPIKGITNAGKTGIQGLTGRELNIIRDFLKNAIEVKSVDRALKLVEEYDNKKIPQITAGIYSPWLYYLNPYIFPIKVSPQKIFLEWAEQSTDSYPVAIELFHEVAEIVGEKNMGVLDAFNYNTEFYDNHELTSNINSLKMIHTKNLNTILYGPPGTGKTYSMQKLIEQMNLKKQIIAKEPDYRNFVSGYHWWELLAIVLFDLKQASVPEMLEHKLIKSKLATSNIQHSPQRLWSTLQLHTVENCPNVKLKNRHGELIFFKETNSSWRLDNVTDFTGQFPYLIEEWETFKNSEIKESLHKNYLFTTCHQSLSYEDFIEGIKPVLSENETGDGLDRGIQYQIRKGLFYQACEKAAQIAGYSTLEEALAVSQEERKITFTNAIAQNKIYAIFLDEINRTNVSAVFGELITLIEDDKRLGGDNEIADTILPYSQTAFGIPANLYLIGTMNTADRSVEALDTALRRRFVFEQMMPQPELLSPKTMIVRMLNSPESINYEWEDEPYRKIADRLYELLGTNKSIEVKLDDWVEEEGEWNIKHLNHINENDFTGINLEKLLIKINYRIQKLLDADHQIGHAFFMNVLSIEQLYNIFYQKIIPQLQEYFYGDFGKIGLVLGSEFISYAQTEQKFSFANFQYEDKDELAEKRVYTIERFHNENGERDFDAFENAVKNVYYNVI
jgi:hypothetical protein